MSNLMFSISVASSSGFGKKETQPSALDSAKKLALASSDASSVLDFEKPSFLNKSKDSESGSRLLELFPSSASVSADDSDSADADY